MKISLLLRTIPAAMAVITTLATGIFYFANEHERDVLLKQLEMRRLGNALLRASDFLTDRARSYVQYGEKRYLDEYLNESQIARTREKTVRQLELLNASEYEINLLRRAKDLSRALEKIERAAFDEVAGGNVENARRMLFSAQYHQGKQPIVDTLKTFQETLHERCEREAVQATRNARTWLAASVTAALVMVIAVFVGAAKMRRMNELIHRNQKDLQRIINSLPLAIIIQDPDDWKVDYANAPFFKLMEMQPDTPLKNIDAHFLHSREQSDGIPLADKQREMLSVIGGSGVAKSMEFTYKTMGGSILEAMLTITELDYGGKKRLIKMIQDIREEKQATSLLKMAAEREREANQLKSLFLANMSHEIRTPMNAIIGLTQIALTREQDSSNVDCYRKINSSARNLLSILNDILDFSKIEAQKMDLVEAEFALEDVLSNALMVALGRIDDKHIEVLLDVAPDTPCDLVGDKTRLWQILKNLLDNSAKYTEQGRIILNVAVSRREENKVYLAFKVSDTGIGMTPEQVDALYSPFQQFSADFKSRTTGTGLGMSIAKQLLELMGGTIQVASQPGIGTEITVTICFAMPEGEAATMGQAINLSKGEECRVLIADDDPQSCEIMRRLLNVVGIFPICVSSGEEALKKAAEYAAMGLPFQLVILDYLLGEEDGISVANQMGQYTTNCKFLMVSAYVKRIPRVEVKAAGFKDVLQKPFVPSVFIRTLFEALDEQHEGLSLEHKNFAKTDVLLCEDNKLNQEVAVGMLKILGIEPDVSCNGRECLDMLEKKHYDLILMDIMMPVMDGKEAIKRIRESDKPWKGICIMAMTANAMLDQVDELLALGADGHIPKPIELETLQDRLAECLPLASETSATERAGQEAVARAAGAAVEASCLAIKGVAVHDGLKRFVGNEKIYKNALMRFANDYQPPANKALSEDIQRTLHTLRGVAGNLGAYDLAALAKEAEDEALKDGAGKESYEKLRTAFDELAGHIRAACG